MQAILITVAGVILSGLIFRLLASISFGIATAAFINGLIDKYLVRSMNEFSTSINPDVAAYLNIARLDDCLSILIGSLTLVATYKSLKIIFVRKA